MALKSNKFDLKDVLDALPKSDAKAVPAKKDDGRVFPADPLPLDALKSVKLALTYQGTTMNFNGVQLDKVNTGIKLSGGKLTVKPLRAILAKGQIDGTVTLDGAGAIPRLVTALTVKKTDVGAMLKKMAVSDMLTGLVDVSVEAKGRGKSVRAIMAGLNGKTEVVMENGTIASKYVNLIAADLLKKIVPSGKSSNHTKINCMVSRFDIKNGLATSRGLIFDTKEITVTGDGKIDLKREKLDLLIKPQPKQAALVSMSVDVAVGGTLKSPSFAPSAASVLKGVAGLALTVVNPASLLLLTMKSGADDKNPCVTALDNPPPKSAAKRAPAKQKSVLSNPVEKVTKGVGGALKSLFGGK